MDEMTIRDIQRMQANAQITAYELTESYLNRIAQIDKSGPKVNSVIEVNPDALTIAKQMDRERAAGNVRSELHGIPILIKDNIDTADQMMTTAGSLALEHSRPQEDAFIVRLLRKAGAVIIGKTNLSEWANFRSSHSTSGWSSRGGLTRNPYALDRSACGSSTGSAAAVAANFAAVAIGTETDGSIICPSSANGIVGIKPTLGLVSRSGIIPIAHSQDTAGPMARTVEDAAILLTALSGFDPDDYATRLTQTRKLENYANFARSGGLINRKIGILRQYWGVDPNVDQVMDAAVEQLRKLGAQIIDPVKIPEEERYGESELDVLLYEFKTDLNKYLSRLGLSSPMKNLEDVINFNNANKERVMPFFGQERMLAAQEKGDLFDEKYKKALTKNHKFARRGTARVFRILGLDALLAPSGTPAWIIDLINGDHYKGGSSSPAAVAGFPSITLPAGFVSGLPVGMSFIGLPFQELKLIEMAAAFEEFCQIRKKPEFKPTIEF